MARTLQQIVDSLNPTYTPQKDLVNAQINAVPGEEAATEASLNTAKDNSFASITNKANASGMLYSGAPINEQQSYLGEKFLPAVANAKAASTSKLTNLQSQLLQITQDQNDKAYGIQKDEQAAEEKGAYDAAQLQIKQQAAAQKTSKAAAAVDPAKGFVKGTDAVGGLSYRDANGNPITAAQYYDAKGATGIGAIVADLGNSKNKGDAAIAKDAASGKFTYDQLLKKYPYVFGGV